MLPWWYIRDKPVDVYEVWTNYWTRKEQLFQLSYYVYCSRWRPYRVEYTGSLSTSEVKRRRARLVLGWGTAWEHLRVLSAFHPCIVFFSRRYHWTSSQTGELKTDRPRQSSITHGSIVLDCHQASCITIRTRLKGISTPCARGWHAHIEKRTQFSCAWSAFLQNYW